MHDRRFRSERHLRCSRLRRLFSHDLYAHCLFFIVASAVSPYGGDYLNSLLFDKLSSQKIQVTPHCFLKKQIVEGVVANIQRIDYPNTRASFLKYAIMVLFLEFHKSKDIVRDMKECCFHLAAKPIKQSFLHSADITNRPPPTTPISYTLPDNQEVHLDQDAYCIPEVMMTGNGTVGLR